MAAAVVFQAIGHIKLGSFPCVRAWPPSTSLFCAALLSTAARGGSAGEARHAARRAAGSVSYDSWVCTRKSNHAAPCQKPRYFLPFSPLSNQPSAGCRANFPAGFRGGSGSVAGSRGPMNR